MTTRKADIVIYGAGIAGLWTLARLKALGYDALLLEKDSIGGGQTIASQGIIHSGLKYAMAGRISELARSISAMPDLWRAALKGGGPVDLSAAHVLAESQHLLIPPGLMGGLAKLIAGKAFGAGVREIPQGEWPGDIKNAGFAGSVINMDEPVLDIPSVIRALAEPYKHCIRKPGNKVEAQIHIYTAAGGNENIARESGHDTGLETQKRPLLMGMMKNAPFPLYAHLVGKSDKPVATITTHTAADGRLVWYIGGGAAERAKKSNPEDVYDAALRAFAKYLPEADLSDAQWAALPIDRVEGKSGTRGWMPDTPTIHEADNALYCWPTKLTFAPLLADMIMGRLEKRGIRPSGAQSGWSFLPEADYTPAPWDNAQWTKRA